mgnify:CR=1 FL=1
MAVKSVSVPRRAIPAAGAGGGCDAGRPWAAEVALAAAGLAAAAVDRFCLSLGSVAGDVALVQGAANPLVMEHAQNTAADTWLVDTGGYLPFGARARNVTALVPENSITNTSNAAQYVLPWAQVEQGFAQRCVNLRWSTPVKGKVNITIRCDNPM